MRNTLFVIATTLMLTSFGAACDASSVVSRIEDKISRTITTVAHALHVGSWGNQTQMGTSTIVVLAWIVKIKLPQWMIDVQIVWTMSCVAKNLIILSSELVSSKDGFEIPVCPVDVIIHQCDGKHMWYQLLA